MRKRTNAQRRGTSRKAKREAKIRSGFQLYPAPIREALTQTIRMQLRNVAVLTSDSSGNVATYVPCDPSVNFSSELGGGSQFPEWATWATLFSHVKCVQLELVLKPATTETKGDITNSLALSGNLQLAASPGTYQGVMDNADSQIYPVMFDTSGRGCYHAIRHRKNLEWASTNTPFPNSDIYSGCPGAIQIFGSGFQNSTGLCDVQVVGTYLVAIRS